MSEHRAPAYGVPGAGPITGPVTLDRGHPDHPDNRVKVGHLVVGLVFLGLAGTWALASSGTISGVSGAVALPLVLVLAGVLGLVAMVVGGVRNRRRVPDPAPFHDDRAHDPEHDTDTEADTDTEDTRVLGTYPEEEHR